MTAPTIDADLAPPPGAPLAKALVGDTKLLPAASVTPVKKTKKGKPRQIFQQPSFELAERPLPTWYSRFVPKQTHWTAIDWFAGIGGSSSGLVQAGFTVIHASNHWADGINTHQGMHPNTGHSQVDITRVDPSFFPTADVGWFSPECKYHSNARGLAREKQEDQEDEWGVRQLKDSDFVDDGDGNKVLTEDAAKRSRAMMEEVVDIVHYNAEIRGVPFKYFVVENVPEVTEWVHFETWWKRLENDGYRLQILSLNSAFAHGEDVVEEPAAPQDRNRAYIVGTYRGLPEPDLEQRPQCWCDSCEKVVEGKQKWKPTKKMQGVPLRRRVGKYGTQGQYIFECRESGCYERVQPYSLPVASVLDFSDPGQTLAERISNGKDPLKPNTMARIEAGALAITLPMLDAMVVSSTSRPGHPARPITERALTLTQRKLLATVLPPTSFLTPSGGTWRTDPRSVMEPSATLTTSESDGYVSAPGSFSVTLRGGGSKDTARPLEYPGGTVTTSGPRNFGISSPPGYLVRNYTPRGNAAQMSTPLGEPARTLTAIDGQGLATPPVGAFVSPYYGYGGNGNGGNGNRSVYQPAPTLTTVEGHALLSPSQQMIKDTLALQADVRRIMQGSKYTKDDLPPGFLMEMRYRMLKTNESALIQGFQWDYQFTGSKRDQAAGIGNAVSPPAARWIGDRIMMALEKTIVRGHNEMVLG